MSGVTAQGAPVAGDPDDPFHRTTIMLTKTMHKDLRRIAFREERSISDVVREMCAVGIEKRKQEGEQK